MPLFRGGSPVSVFLPICRSAGGGVIVLEGLLAVESGLEGQMCLHLFNIWLVSHLASCFVDIHITTLIA